MKVDYLIIGQGLAGSVLSYQLLRQKKHVLVIDDPRMRSSSGVAAGLFNPITGRRMVKTWLAEELFPRLIDFYREMEGFLGCRFLYEKPIYRPFLNVGEQNEWMGKSADVHLQKFIRKVHRTAVYADFINDPYGGLELNFSGYVDIATLLSEYRAYLRRERRIVEEAFEEEKLLFTGQSAKYESIEASKVILCDGPLREGKKYFSWLPFRRVKGEILIIKPECLLPVVFNRGLFILPLENGLCKVGSTYDWKDTAWDITEKAEVELREKLDIFFNKQYEVMDQVAGIRPATADRKPFLGAHPELERLLVFNGFGTKGVSLMPYFSDKFCNFLSNGKELPFEVNINRYFSLY